MEDALHGDTGISGLWGFDTLRGILDSWSCAEEEGVVSLRLVFWQLLDSILRIIMALIWSQGNKYL